MSSTHSRGPAGSLFALSPLVIGALHLPDLAVARDTPMAALEDYALRNAEVFARAGVPALMLQDATRGPGPASPETIAAMSAIGRLLRREFPQVALGIIVQAHDAPAPLAIAHATGASFVRIKVYVGGVMAADGPRHALATTAQAYRHDLRRDDIAILADVHDRTSVPLADVPLEMAAAWAQQHGADGLILTGADFRESIDWVGRARAAGVRIPILIGGSVTEGNVDAALAGADGVIVSRSLMKAEVAPGDSVRWDLEAAMRFMERAGAAGARRAP